MGVSGQVNFWAALSPGGKTCLEAVEKREISWPLPKIEPRFLDRSVHSLVTEMGLLVIYGELLKQTVQHVLNVSCREIGSCTL
jgi:hypothetical protein